MAIQFPARYGVDAPQPAAAGGNSTYGHTPDPKGQAVPASAPQAAVVDRLVLQGAAIAALELDLLSHWDDGGARERGAAEFQLARAAAQSGDHEASLQHLEHAILADPVHAEAARQDPAFNAMRGAVQELVGHASLLARMRAESSIDAAFAAMESVRGTGAGPHADQVKVFLDLAQAHFELGTYTAYVEAAQAAMRARQLAEDPLIQPLGKFSGRPFRANMPRTPGPARRAVRRLWDKLPLLAILLGWLLAGIVGGVAALPFQDGEVSETRQTLFSIWALGLLAMVLLGFVRSILRLRRDRLL
jgi:tetratricopeptide (TPR) repeat protein